MTTGSGDSSMMSLKTQVLPGSHIIQLTVTSSDKFKISTEGCLLISSAGHKSFCSFLFLLKNKKTFVGIYLSDVLIFSIIKNYVTCLSRNHLLAMVCAWTTTVFPQWRIYPCKLRVNLTISSGDNKGL